jgi:hypothetical protein
VAAGDPSEGASADWRVWSSTSGDLHSRKPDIEIIADGDRVPMATG